MNKQEKPILELSGVSKEFPGVKALDKVQLKLYPGKCTTLMGENGAGKSTIMKVIFGIHQPSEGEVYFQGEKIKYKNPKEALESGIAMVHQELNQVLTASVMDNMFIGRYPKNGPMFVDKVKMYEETKRIFDELKIDVDPRMNIGKLTVSQRQMIEIARAVSYNSKVLILDEPTSSLTDNEVDKLMKIVEDLKSKGVAIMFVSHKMEEIRRISTTSLYLEMVNEFPTNPIEKIKDSEIIKQMVGRDMDDQFPEKTKTPSKDEPIILDVKKLKAKFLPRMGEVKFSLQKGEILGIAGLVGSNRTEIVEMLFGLRTKTQDSMILHRGKEVKNRTPHEAISNGFALVTEERKRDGIFPIKDLTFNTAIVQTKEYANPFGWLNQAKMVVDTKHMMKQLDTRAPNEKVEIGSLSGGNQQKVVLSKWLATQPEILLLDEPTRGIDVGAKFQIYKLMKSIADPGKGVIVISSELPELIGTCHRILVMSNGQQAGIVDGNNTSQEELMTLAAKNY